MFRSLSCIAKGEAGRFRADTREGLIRGLERPPSFSPPSLVPGTGFPELDPGTLCLSGDVMADCDDSYQHHHHCEELVAEYTFLQEEPRTHCACQGWWFPHQMVNANALQSNKGLCEKSLCTCTSARTRVAQDTSRFASNNNPTTTYQGYISLVQVTIPYCEERIP